MNNLSDRPLDRTLILVSLLVMKEFLHLSHYPAEVQKQMKQRIDDLVAELNRPLPEVDAYGNRHST